MQPAVPNPRPVGRHWSVGQLVQGRTERINNIAYFFSSFHLSIAHC